jgi:putative transposase
MKKTKFSEQQIAVSLQQVESGTSVSELCRQIGISEATFYRWKRLHTGLAPPDAQRLRQFEEENVRLRKLVADLTLEKEFLQEMIRRRI